MTTKLEGVKVFIASPGGLAEERRVFRDALAQHNRMDANARGVNLMPIGWEDTLGGLGRPQSRINADMRDCDYAVVVFHDRWGSPPGSEDDTGYTSGTEEEYFTALSCIEDPALPMKGMVVFFKNVDAERLAAPDEQLRKVLDFRKRIERSTLYETFDDPASFEARLRPYLFSWVREHEGTRGAGLHPMDRPPSPRQSDQSAGSQMEHADPIAPAQELVREAERLAAEGRLTEAEIELAKGVARAGDVDSLASYGWFLLENGRIAQAERMFRRAQTVAEQSPDPLSMLQAIDGLAHIFPIFRS